MAIALRTEGLSKQYRIGAQRERYRTLRESITQMSTAPFRAVKSAFSKKDRSAPDRTLVWALEDVSFEVERGDVIGVIGRNGAGKSTLLKLLSKITEPTKGFAEVRGRIGSLLEVGTGFHNELTGRENIFLNGAILGMRRAEISRKFDEIVAFAEVDKFIDTPVKRYSSGMYLRLAFAVAAHLEPEILLVDEVLAVGDAAFQKKCMGRLDSIAKEGRTVLFVSHNMGAIRSMCTKGIVLNKGRLEAAGDIGTAMAAYYRQVGALDAETAPTDKPTGTGFGHVTITAEGGGTVISQSKEFDAGTTLTLTQPTGGFMLHCHLVDMFGREVFQLRESNTTLGLSGVTPGTYAIKARFPPLWLSPGLYALWFKVEIAGEYGSARHVTDKATVDVEGTSGAVDNSLLHPGVTWDIHRR